MWWCDASNLTHTSKQANSTSLAIPFLYCLSSSSCDFVRVQMFHMSRHAVSVAYVSCLQLQAILGSTLNDSTTFFLDGITGAYCHEQVNGLPSIFARFTPKLCQRRRLESSQPTNDASWDPSHQCKAETLFPGALPRAFVERLLWRYTEEVGWVSGPAIIEAPGALIVGEFDHYRQEKLHGRVIQERCCWIGKW